MFWIGLNLKHIKHSVNRTLINDGGSIQLLIYINYQLSKCSIILGTLIN